MRDFSIGGFMWWLVGVVVIVVVGVILSKTRQEVIDPTPPPVKGDELAIWPFSVMPIMTDSEVIFFKKLVEALPEYLIFSQVQLSRIIEPSDDVGNDRAFWFNRICRQSVDYVVVAKDCQTVLLAIELDDWTHESKTRQKQDEKKDKALASAGVAVVRFHAERMPSVQMIRHDVLMVLQEL